MSRYISPEERDANLLRTIAIVMGILLLVFILSHLDSFNSTSACKNSQVNVPSGYGKQAQGVQDGTKHRAISS